MFEGMLRVLDEGGLGGQAVLVCALFTHPFAAAALVAAFVSKKKAFVRNLALVALVLSLGTAVLGVAGYELGLRGISDTLANAPPTQIASMRAYALRMNRSSLTWGALATIVPALLSVLALKRSASMPDGDTRSAP